MSDIGIEGATGIPGTLDVSWAFPAPLHRCCGGLYGAFESVALFFEHNTQEWLNAIGGAAWTTGFLSLFNSTTPSALTSMPAGAGDDPNTTREDHFVGQDDSGSGFTAAPEIDGAGTFGNDGLTWAGLPNLSGLDGVQVASRFRTTAGDHIFKTWEAIDPPPGSPPYYHWVSGLPSTYWPGELNSKTSVRFCFTTDGPWRLIDGEGVLVTYTKRTYSFAKNGAVDPFPTTDGSTPGEQVLYGPSWDEPTYTDTVHTINLPIAAGFDGTKRTDWVHFTASEGECVTILDTTFEPLQQCIGDS